MAVNIGPRIGIDGEAEYRKQIQNIIQETKTLKSEYEKVSSSMDNNTSSLKRNAEQHKLLEERIEVQKDRVQKLGEMVEKSAEKYGEADTKTLKWKQALNEAETELNRLEQELKELPNSIQIVGEKMEAAGEKISAAGDKLSSFGQALTPISTAAAGGLTVAAKTFIDFESGMSKVAAVSGATGDNFQKLVDKAKEMGATTSFSATEAAEGLYYMGLAGWKTEEMIDGIAPVMNLAAAAGEELGTVSDIVTDAITAFGLEAKDTAHFVDVLAAASTNSNTTVSMMGEAFKYAAPVAGSLGYSVDDVAIALGLMANSGIKADMAGTSLRNMMQRMAKPTKESAMAMERLGLSLTDDEGNMLSLRQIMDQLRKSFGKINMPVEQFNQEMDELNRQLEDGELTENKYGDAVEELARQAYGAEGAEKARAAAMLGGTRAMAAMLSLANATEEDYNQLTVAIDRSTGAAQKMADTMLDNVQGSLTLAKSALEGAAIEAGEVLAPYITKAADTVKELSERFSALSQSEQDNIVKAVALTAAAAPLLSGAGKLVSGVGDLVTVGGQFLGTLGALGPEAVVAVGAFTAITSGVIALQEHLDSVNAERIGAAISENLINPGGVPIEGLFESVNGLIDEMSSGFQSIADSSQTLTTAQQNVADTVFELDKVKTSLENGVTTAEEAVPRLEELLSELATNVEAEMSAAGDVLLKTFGEGGALTTAYDATGNGIENVTKRVQEATKAQNDKVEELQERLRNAQPLSDEWYQAYDELLKISGGVDALQAAEDAIDSYMQGNPLNWEKYLNSDGELQIGRFQDDLDATITKAGEFKTATEESLNSAVDAARQLGDEELLNEIRNGIPDAMDYSNGQIAAKATEATDAIQNDLIGGIDEVVAKAQEDWKSMGFLERLFIYDNNEANFIQGQLNKYKKDYIDPLSNEIETGMNEIGVNGAGWASDASQEIIKSLFDIEHNYDEVSGADTTTLKLKSDWDRILKETGDAATKTANERGADIVKGFNQGVYDNTGTSEGEVTTWMDKIKQAIHDSAMKFGSPSKTAEEFGKDTIDGFDEGIDKNTGLSERSTSTWLDMIEGLIDGSSKNINDMFGEMGDTMSDTMNTAYEDIKSSFRDIKSVFDNTKLNFPKIELPHISISGEFSIDPPSAPHFSIDWHAKAMESGMLLSSPTIFGASGNKLLAGGEAGNEWIVGQNSLYGMIQSAVRSSVGYIPEGETTITIGDTEIVINAAPGQDIEELADEVDEIIAARHEQARNAWARYTSI